jgi:hypothetical protein
MPEGDVKSSASAHWEQLDGRVVDDQIRRNHHAVPDELEVEGQGWGPHP